MGNARENLVRNFCIQSSKKKQYCQKSLQIIRNCAIIIVLTDIYDYSLYIWKQKIVPTGIFNRMFCSDFIHITHHRGCIMKKGLIMVATAAIGFGVGIFSSQQHANAEITTHRVVIEDHCDTSVVFDQQIILNDLTLTHPYRKNFIFCDNPISLVISPQVSDDGKVKKDKYFASITRWTDNKVTESIHGTLSGKETVIWVKSDRFQQVRRK